MVTSSQSVQPMATITGLIRELRPWQWYKQGVMLLGIIFSQNIFTWSAWSNLLIGIMAFITISSATYIFNDIGDLEEDRNHPEKQHRPIASGQVSVPVAGTFGLILVVIGLGAAYSLGPLFFAILIAYLVQNALYSLVLKQFVLIDVLIIAIGFVLRAIAGVFAINVFLSPWLIMSTFLLALVLAFGKRRNELKVVTNPQEARDVLAEYSENQIDQLLVIVISTLLMSYSLYTFSRTDPRMMATLPFAFFGVFRYHHLVHTTDIAGRPEYILTDWPSAVNLLLWGMVAITILYNVPEIAIEVVW